MVFSKKLRNHRKILKQLNNRDSELDIFVVALRDGGLEIYQTKQFWQRKFPIEGLHIIAAFNLYDEAVEFIRMLTEYSYNKLKAVNFAKAYDMYREEIL